MRTAATIAALAAAMICSAATAAAPERIYLSGTGLGDTRTWDFICTGGMRAGQKGTIEVPSQWELQGYGEYSYGRWYVEGRTAPPQESGIYSLQFDVPQSWRGMSVRIIFEGVMTDAEVKVNGRSAGPVHRGAFYEFSFDISSLLRYGKSNSLQVRVDKESADKSVNAAERKADWWIFGGIYRPVYLEAKPAVHIQNLALDPRADGTLRGRVYTTPLEAGHTLAISLDGGEEVLATLGRGCEHEIEAAWESVEPWDAEHPNLHTLAFALRDSRGRTLHETRLRTGFRTVEVRAGDGIYVNGVKTILKGINRHSFHPDGGRTTNRATSLQDGLLIKQMNMNAVRVHYAPDRHFLDVCDSLGIYVVDELAGWHGRYSTEAGVPLLREFVMRDVNRPSVIIWSNGNEGGFNTDFDGMFPQLDPQKRTVIHAWADFGDIDTHHYPAYQTGIARFTNGHKIFMPTEFMHGMYDQGHGAGLEDFWNKYTASPLFAGGFMWDFSDNAVRRSDRAGALDSDGSNGADGILGPYREKEASYYAVRDIWAPVQFAPLRITPSFDGRILVRNDYLSVNLGECRARYRLLKADGPGDEAQVHVIAEGEVSLPDIEPRCSAYARMELPANFAEADILEITAFHPSGLESVTKTWPVTTPEKFAEKTIARGGGRANLSQNAQEITLSAGGVEVTIDRTTGFISRITNSAGRVPFGGGPVPVGLNARVQRAECRMEGGCAVATVWYSGAVDSIRWEMTGSGLLTMNAVMLNRSGGGNGFDDALSAQGITNLGFSFDSPESESTGVRWMGRGPYRVWKNRLRGMNLGIWDKEYNDTQTGAAYDRLVYPEFKGYHAETYWATLRNRISDFTVICRSEGIYLRLYTPGEPEDNKTFKALPDFPEGDISFLYEIPAIRSFKPVAEHGPNSQPGHVRVKKGDEGIRMVLTFDFRAASSSRATISR